MRLDSRSTKKTSKNHLTTEQILIRCNYEANVNSHMIENCPFSQLFIKQEAYFYYSFGCTGSLLTRLLLFSRIVGRFIDRAKTYYFLQGKTHQS